MKLAVVASSIVSRGASLVGFPKVITGYAIYFA